MTGFEDGCFDSRCSPVAIRVSTRAIMGEEIGEEVKRVFGCYDVGIKSPRGCEQTECRWKREWSGISVAVDHFGAMHIWYYRPEHLDVVF